MTMIALFAESPNAQPAILVMPHRLADEASVLHWQEWKNPRR
ncbi:hypothetical protein [Aquabacterium sp.]